MGYDDKQGVQVTGFRRIFESLTSVFRRGDAGGPIISQPVNAAAARETNLIVWQARESRADNNVRTRVDATREKLKVWDNDYEEALRNKLRRAFHPENFHRMQFVLHMNTNVLRRIVEDISILYENPAKRKLVDDLQGQTEAGEDPTSLEKDVTQPEAKDKPKPPPKKADEEEPEEDEEEEDTEPDGKKPPPFGAKKDETEVDPAAPRPAPDGGALQTGDPDVDALADVLELTGSKSEDEETPFDKLMKAYDWDVLLDMVEKLCNICPVVWVRPLVCYEKAMFMKDVVDEDGNATGQTTEVEENDESTGRLNYIIYTPDNADVVLDPKDPTQAIAFYYYGDEVTQQNGKPVQMKVIHFWSKQMYFKFDMEWRELYREPHSMKRLPVTPFRLHLPRNGYFVDGVGDDLYEATMEVCILKTLQNSRAKDGAFKQLAIQGDPASVPADQVMGGPTPIMLGDDNVASVLDFQPALDQFTDMWEKRETSLGARYGISAADYKSEGHPQSGFAKKLDRDKVLKESKRRRKFFAKGEQDLYNNTATVLKESPLPGIPALDPSKELQTDFSEPTFEEDPETQAKTDAIELKFNAISVVDVLRRRNPDLNDVELIKLAHRNKKINEVFMTQDQMRLVDIMASGAIAGASLDTPGKEGGPPPPGEDKGKPKFGGGAPSFGKKPPFGG